MINPTDLYAWIMILGCLLPPMGIPIFYAYYWLEDHGIIAKIKMPKNKEGNYIEKYYYLLLKGYKEKDAKDMAMMGITRFKFEPDKTKKRLRKYRIWYGVVMQQAFTYIAVCLAFWKPMGIPILILVIIYLYRVLMKLRYMNETIFEGGIHA